MVLDGGAVVTHALGANTETFRAALFTWAEANGATKDGRIHAWRLGSLLAKVRR